MRATFSPSLALLLLLGAGSAAAAPQPQDPSLAQFEERFVNSLPYGDGGATTNDTTLRLVGFKRMAVPAAEVAAFEAAWAEQPAMWRRSGPDGQPGAQPFWYDRAKREVRVYFPVEGALLARGGGAEFAEADAMGQVHGVGEVLKRELDGEGRGRAVLGRRVSEQVSGVEGNTIRDGVM